VGHRQEQLRQIWERELIAAVQNQVPQGLHVRCEDLGIQLGESGSELLGSESLQSGE
jgi:hypothetical protein